MSYDLLGTGQLLLSDYGQYEAALRINLKDRYFPIIELGIGKADAEDESTRITYKTQAPYGRIGIDFNMLKNKHDIYRLYAGGRYAYTSYKFDISSPGVIDPNYGGMAHTKPMMWRATCTGWNWPSVWTPRYGAPCILDGA